MIRVCGATLGLLAFGVTIVLGLAAGNPTVSTLGKAVWALLIFCGIGLVMGWVAWRVIDDYTVTLRGKMWPESAGEGEATPADSTGLDSAGQNPAGERA